MSRMYTKEKLSEGVLALATGAGRIKERVEAAAVHFAAANPDGISQPEARRLYDEAWSRLTARKQPDGEGSIGPSLEAMTEEDAQSIAMAVVGGLWSMDVEGH